MIFLLANRKINLYMMYFFFSLSLLRSYSYDLSINTCECKIKHSSRLIEIF